MDLKEVYKAIEDDKATFVGEGPWFKDSASQVYQYANRTYVITIYDSMNCWLLEDTLEEIKLQEIKDFI